MRLPSGRQDRSREAHSPECYHDGQEVGGSYTPPLRARCLVQADPPSDVMGGCERNSEYLSVRILILTYFVI